MDAKRLTYLTRVNAAEKELIRLSGRPSAEVISAWRRAWQKQQQPPPPREARVMKGADELWPG